MFKRIITLAAIMASLSGCVATVRAQPDVEVSVEPDVVVGAYPLGWYDPAYGYWTGFGWDWEFYAYGHPGYGHHYHGYYEHWEKPGHGRPIHPYPYHHK